MQSSRLSIASYIHDYEHASQNNSTLLPLGRQHSAFFQMRQGVWIGLLMNAGNCNFVADVMRTDSKVRILPFDLAGVV